MKKITEGMTDMKRDARERNRDSMPVAVDGDQYAYGLNIRLENAELDKLGIKSMPEPGERFEIHAVGKVSSAYVSKSEHNRGDRAVQIQITHLTLTRKTNFE